MESIDVFEMAYTALGGLGLFFLGLRFLSESLQAIAGDFIKKLIAFATSNRILAVIVGITVTGIVQSSSISTVMVVGLVNAGLMNLTQAIGVILGANIGTTITGWILVVKVGKYGLLLIGLGILPYLFSKQEKISATGRVVLALGLIFVGLEFMSGAFKPLRSSEDFLSFLHIFDTAHIPGLLGCVVIGCILTFIIQSSSAMLGITIALASTGTIDYPTAAALVLGENIGTTITALLACIGTNTQAIRAAVSHALFNLIGVGIILLLFHPYISFIDWLVPGNPEVLSSDGSKLYIAAHIAMGHTVFNVSATLIMLPFLALFAKLVERLVPERGRSTFKLKHINSSVPAISGVKLSIARLELEHMVRLVGKALLRAERFIPKGKTDKRYFESVEKIEKITDNIQKEITSYVCQVIGQSLNNDQADEAYSLIRAADELESIADYCYSVCRYRSRLERYGQDFSSAGWEDVTTYYREIREFYRFVAEAVINEDLSKSDEIRKRGTELNKIADELRDRHIQRMGAGICQPLPALAFSDMIIALRRVKNHTINLFHASFYHADRSDSTDIGSLIISNLQRE